jgi:ribosome maturation factor RimP
MYDDLRNKIWELAEPIALSEGMELIHVECLKMHTRWVFRLFLDKEGGVTLDDCTTISNQLGDILDIHDLSRGPYTLEVSSPGLDRPVSRDQDFVRFRGAKVKIKTHVKIDGMKNFQGRLVDFTDEGCGKVVQVEVSGKIFKIPKDEIAKANLFEEETVILE